MALQALLFADAAGWQAWLGRCLGDDIAVLPADANDPQACVAEVDDTPDIAVVFVAFGERDNSRGLAMIEQLVRAHAALPVIALGASDNNADVLAAMRAGARDFFVAGRDEARARSLLDRVLENGPATPRRAPAGGQVVTLFSAPQSPLIAFTAGHIAFALAAAKTPAQRVLLFDLSLPGGTAPILFDASHDYNALDILRDVERCDETLVDSAFQRLDNGTYLLALPEGFDWAQMPRAGFDLARLLEIFRSLFDYVVISVDAGLGPERLQTLVGHSDRALLVSDQSVLRSRQNKTLLDVLRQRDARIDDIALVIINYRAELGLAPERLAELLDLELAATIGGRPAQRIAAMNAGESMFAHAPNDGFVHDITRLTERIVGADVSPPRRRRGLAALFTRAGR
ncbi:hypothetical protein T5B8_15075 [Salinisphaera sp. T5B8]|uniref:AAA family ATPase n=1 Tax=Salinisphaera sp. T5B8 TaxID=1304154 RepID=UPI003340F486